MKKDKNEPVKSIFFYVDLAGFFVINKMKFFSTIFFEKFDSCLYLLFLFFDLPLQYGEFKKYQPSKSG